VAKLKTRKVFFVHMSVGTNLMNGIRSRGAGGNGVDVRTVSDATLNSVGSETALYEYHMTQISAPRDKIASFQNAMNNHVKGNVDIAFMKFCYNDFNQNTDVERLFEDYKNAVTELQNTHQKVRFVHSTVPLYAARVSWQNNVREQFNALLRKTYKSKVFDLATMESVDSDNNTAQSIAPSIGTIAAADEWTSDDGSRPNAPSYFDGGHFNIRGEERFGGALIAFLAQVQLE